MEQTILSIIIPVYNAEVFIEECLDSVLRQTLGKIEVICIDDGSTDNSLVVLHKYASQNPCIKVYKKEHSGSGDTRNFGMTKATGKYISFLDADDFLYTDNALEIMVNACEANHVNVCGSIIKVYEKEKVFDIDMYQKLDIGEGKLVYFKDYQNDFYYQAFIYNREFLIRENIVFPNYLRYQDPPFLLKVLIASESFWALPINMYCYRFGHQNIEGISGKVNDILHGIADTLKMAIDYNYETLYIRIMQRLNEEYFEVIMKNLSCEVMETLLKIDSINHHYKNSVAVAELEFLSKIYQEHLNFLDLLTSHKFLLQIVDIMQKDGYTRYFKERNIKKVIVYGLGQYGDILVNILLEIGIEIVAYVDAKKRTYRGYDVLPPDAEFPESDAIIISMLYPKEVLAEYGKKGYKNVITFRDIVQYIVLSE